MRKKLLSRRKPAAKPMKAKAEGNVLYLEREFEAPRELLFQAFAQPEHLTRWWGPAGWSLPVCNVDLRPGGSWHYCMASPDGSAESWGKSIYREIAEPERLVYEDYVSDEEETISSETPGLLVTLSFDEKDGTTKLVNRAEFASAEGLRMTLSRGLIAGMGQTWERLAEHLRTLQQS